MPGIDASIPLGVKPPDQMQNLSSLLGVAKGAQEVQQGGISLNERQAVQGVLADPGNYTDPDGTVNFTKALPAIMKVAPTTGMQYVQKLAEAQRAHTEAQQTINNLSTDNRSRIGGVLAAIPPGSAPDVVEKTVDALGKQYKGMAPLVETFKQAYRHKVQTGGQAAGDNYLLEASRQVLPQETQQTMNTPGMVTLDNGQQSVGVNIKPGVQGMPQGAPVPGTAVQKLIPVGSQEGVTNDSQGNMHVVQKDHFGNVVGTRPLQGAAPAAPGPFTLPQGETKESMAELQAQRTSAQQTANSAPVMHDINQTIVREASKGLNTGSLGQLTQKVASATGYNMAGESATDYNLLGKMLERSALTAAQSMGPHTNAGLEASIRANGSLDYTPTAIKKIAYLNDALVSGAELYRDGLEKAIGSNQNNIFAKREFDQKWSKVATPQALRLKNAVDNKNPEEVSSILKEVGGRGSEGATKLHKQLTELIKLSGR
jgi:hypothetical protein